MKTMAKLLPAVLVLVLTGCAVVPYGPPIGVGVYVGPGSYGPHHSGRSYDRHDRYDRRGR